MGLCCCKRDRTIEHDDNHDDKTSVLEPQESNVSASSIHPSLFSSDSIANPCHLTWLTDIHINNIDTDDDEMKHTCRISGLCCLDNGRTVLMDRNNQMLMVFDPEFQYAYRQKIRKQLISLTTFEFDNIAILETGFIGLYNISGKYVTRLPVRFTVGKNPRAVTFNGSLFAVLYVQNGNNFVKIYSKDGIEHETIPLSIQIEKRKYRSNSIVLDRSNDHLYLPNMSEKCISCVNFLGEVVWNSVTVDHILHPSCLMLEGNFIYCCDWLTKGVNLVSLDGKRSTSICVDGVKKARFVAFQRKKQHLIIFTDFKYKLRIFDVLLPPEEC